MIPNQELLIGVFLILAGIVLAIFAYIVLTSKEPISLTDEDEEEPRDVEEDVPSQLADETVSHPEPEDPEAPPDTPSPDISAAPAIVTSEALPGIIEEEPKIVDEVEPPSPAPEFSPVEEHKEIAPARERIAIASLFRDEVSGELIIQVGDRVYVDGESLKDSSDFTRVQYAVKDLNEWIEVKPAVSTSAPRETDVSPPQAQSMIEQINEILQQKIISSDVEQKAVRLIEGPGGSVRVLVGVQSYDLGEVPDDEIQELIRESVAIWESQG